MRSVVGGCLFFWQQLLIFSPLTTKPTTTYSNESRKALDDAVFEGARRRRTGGHSRSTTHGGGGRKWGGGGCHTYTHKQHNSKPPHTNRMNDNDSNEGKSTGVYARVFEVTAHAGTEKTEAKKDPWWWWDLWPSCQSNMQIVRSLVGPTGAVDVLVFVMCVCCWWFVGVCWVAVGECVKWLSRTHANVRNDGMH